MTYEPFLQELDSVFELIQTMPLRFPEVRRALLGGYPFACSFGFDRPVATLSFSPYFRSEAIRSAGHPGDVRDPRVTRGRHRG